MKNLVVFASGSGTNFQSVINAVTQGNITARITGLITNKDGIKALDRAAEANIPAKIISPKNYSDPQEYVTDVLSQLNTWKPDLIVLAGYLLKVPDAIVGAYPNKIINIHPSLLPKYGGKGFYGHRVHKAVIQNGDSQSGCTVHFVNSEYDQGDIIRQAKVDVLPDDTPETLANRVLEQEHTILPKVIAELLTK